LTAVLSVKFYPPGNNTFALIAYLATFAVGFVVRPFGALFFGRIGDLIGRKYAFLATLSIMGGATFTVGLMPTFAKTGLVFPDRIDSDSGSARSGAWRRAWRCPI
jgi:MFS family permease